MCIGIPVECKGYKNKFDALSNLESTLRVTLHFIQTLDKLWEALRSSEITLKVDDQDNIHLEESGSSDTLGDLRLSESL